MPAANTAGGTWIREPDGANLLYYSPELWHDPPTALKNKNKYGKWYRAGYDKLPDNVHWPQEIEKLAPGEWVRIH